MPENRQGNRQKPKTDHLKTTQWKPGQSGNPGGRPRDLLTREYRQLLGELVPGDPTKRTFARLIAEAIAREAVKGKWQAAIEIADRTEGKAMHGLQVSGPGGGAIALESLTPEENERRILELLAKAGMMPTAPVTLPPPRPITSIATERDERS